MQESIKILSACLTPLIAIIATYIAYQQWRTNRTKLRLELYDRRFKIYNELAHLFRIFGKDFNIEPKDSSAFIVSVSEADFLFETEIPDYLQEVFDRALKLNRLKEEYKDSQENPEKYDIGNIINGKEEEITWFIKQNEWAKEKFRKYLDIKYI